MEKIEVKYDGEYPNLCSGNLTVIIDGIELNFPSYCLSSGGNVWFDDDWVEYITSGPWSIDDEYWPDNFPEELKCKVMDEINCEIPHGCCGGCV